MINTIVDIKDIEFEIKADESLLKSIKERGIAIPIHVEKYEDKYKCIDGHKRLTCALELSKENDKYRRIPIMILNDYSKAGSSFWGNTQNKH